MPAEQNFANHMRLDPAYHYFLMPVFLLNLFISIGLAFKTFRVDAFLSLWRVVVAGALFMAASLLRNYALRVQDRVIRLEEQLRLAALLPAAEAAVLGSLSVRQMIALRFASDTEAPQLAIRAAAEQLTPKQIKAAVTHWRSDLHRV